MLRQGIDRGVPPAAIRLMRSAADVVRELNFIAMRTRSRQPWPGYGLPFNGQLVRLRTAHALLSAYGPDVLLETGTHLGDTTRFLLGNAAPVYSVELKWLFWLFAKLRLGWTPELRLIRGDSMDALREMRAGSYDRPFAYLDAHWEDRLPLYEEVSALLAGWPEVLILIDDFQVPADEGYSYDSFDGRPFELTMLELPAGVAVAYPAVPSEEETGGRRGYVYIAQGNAATAAMESAIGLGLLREAAP